MGDFYQQGEGVTCVPQVKCGTAVFIHREDAVISVFIHRGGGIETRLCRDGARPVSTMMNGGLVETNG